MPAADFDFLMSSSNDSFHLAMILLIGLFFGLWSILIKYE